MKKIAFFCIPAHGHTNPMLPVAAELVRRGDEVRFYSFRMFEEKIRATGAAFVACDEFLPELTEREESGLKRVSTTEMTIQDIRVTLNMDEFLSGEFAAFRPDVVYTDSVCFWGKLNAWKHGVPMVVSTSTFAFNQLSSRYMKQSPREIADMVLGLPRISRELKKLKPYGYPMKGVFSLIQSDNATDSVVYTSKAFQPYAAGFSDRYLFAGPSVFSGAPPRKEKTRPLVYVSMGTVINDRPEFYRSCIEALQGMDADGIIACGDALDPSSLGPLPDNVKVFPRVDQLDVLSRADVFISHCGMNSVSESLYMATPLVLYPQTNEQRAVARRVEELGAGAPLRDDSAEGIKKALREVLDSADYGKAAARRSADFRACPGVRGAADFIESTPHATNGVDPLKALNRANGRFNLIYRLAAVAAFLLVGFTAGWRYSWIVGLAAGLLASPSGGAAQDRNYRRMFGEEEKG